MIHVVALAGVGGRVVQRALGNPLADGLNLRRVQRLLALGHLGLAVRLGCDELDEVRLLRRLRDDGGFLAVARAEQQLEIRHHVAAAGLRGLVATLAVGLEDRAHVLVITDLLRGRGFLVSGRGEEAGSREREDAEAGQEWLVVHGLKVRAKRRRGNRARVGESTETRRQVGGEIHQRLDCRSASWGERRRLPANHANRREC